LRFSFPSDITLLTSCVIAIILTIVHPNIAAVLAYSSAVWAGDEDPVWPHLVLIPGSVLAGTSVGAGIVFERPKYSTAVHRVAFWLVVVGVAVESVVTVLLFVVDERISNALETRLNARTEELLTVRKLTADRSLTPDEQKSLTTALSAFPGQAGKIVIFPVNFETVWLADQIWGAMLHAKWEIDPPERLLTPPNMLVLGSFIDASDDDASQRAAAALFEALKSTGVPAGGKMGKGVRARPLQFDPTKPLVWMLIGDKPLPILDWVK
jgi:hypothetical protein